MVYKTLPIQTYIRQVLDYDAQTGDLRWRKRPTSHFSSPEGAAYWNARYAGTPAGYRNGYGCNVGVNGRRLKVARVIWRWMTGDDPGQLQIDHVDHDPFNNIWSNLRLAGWPGQQQNRDLDRYGNKYGFRGVVRHNKKFCAVVNANDVRHRSKDLPTPEEAALAYCKMARELHKEFYCPPSYELEAADVAAIDELYPALARTRLSSA